MRSFGNFFILAFSVCVLSIFTSCESNDFDYFTTVDDNKNATITHETSDKLLEPLSVEETDSFSAEFALRTDVPKANVYINGNYQGRSPLRIKEMVPGYYKLKVEFAQSVSEIIIKEYLLELESGTVKEYYIEK